MTGSRKRMILAGMAFLLVQGAGGPISHAQIPSPREQVARLESQVKEHARKIMELDESIDQRINKIIGDLRTMQDSPDSRTKVTSIKQESLKKLNNSVKWYQAERVRRLTALRTGVTYLSKEDLTNDIAKIEARIDDRINDIVGLTDSFQKQTDFSSYNNSSDAARNDKKVGSRAVVVQGKVEDAIEADSSKLEDEILRLEADLPYKKGRDRELLEQQILKDEEIIRTRREQADRVGEGGGSTGARQVGRKEALHFEESLKRDTDSVRNDMRKLQSLVAELDALRASLKAAQEVLKKQPSR